MGQASAYVHIGVGFCVARSDRVGNAKASMRGTGDGDWLHAFLLYKLIHQVSSVGSLPYFYRKGYDYGNNGVYFRKA